MSLSPGPIYAAIPVPTSATAPSTTCLQWTADGQLIVATKTAVYVLASTTFLGRSFTMLTCVAYKTPDLGIAFESQYSVRTPSPGEPQPAEEAAALGLFRTMIEVDKNVLHHWPIECRGIAAESAIISLLAISYTERPRLGRGFSRFTRRLYSRGRCFS